LGASARKLCIVNPYEHGGGAEYQIGLLIDALAATGRYDVHYLARYPHEGAARGNYRLTRIGSGPASRLGYVMDALPLYRALLRLQPDVIYQRVACAYTGICAVYSRRQRVPLVWHVAHDTDITPRVLDAGRNLLRLQLEKYTARFGARRATRIVVQSEHQAELLRTHFGRDADAIVPNFHPPATQTIDKSGPPTVVWIANLKQWKRPEAFVRLAAGLRDRVAARFIMVGAPADAVSGRDWQPSLMQSIAATPNLEYLGRRSHDEVNELLARARVYVNTSEHEGFPNTFIQAWQRECAVVSLSVDPDRVLERQRVGICAQSEPALAQAVTALLEDPGMLAGYAGRGRDYALRQHSLANAQSLIRLLDA